MTDTKPIILIGVGALIIGAVFASVPREDRAVQWPVIGGVLAGGALAAAVALRKGWRPAPKNGRTVTPSGAVVIPFRRAS